MTPADTGTAILNSHIRALADANGIGIRETPGRYDAVAGKDRSDGARWIRIPPIRTPITYYTALHELGHLLGEPGRYRLDEEARAWEWALANAAEPPSPGVRKMIRRNLRSYLRWALHRQHRLRGRPIVPEPEHIFWRLAGYSKADARFISHNARRSPQTALARAWRTKP